MRLRSEELAAREAEFREVGAAAAELVEAVAGTLPMRDLPPAVRDRFNGLALRAPFVYWLPPVIMQASPPPPTLRDPSTWHLFIGRGMAVEPAGGLPNQRGRKTDLYWTPLYIRTPGLLGHAVDLLSQFLTSPSRDRLKRCQACRRWFVDETRNRSARRCSRKCTIAWSNAQRSTTRRDTKSTARKARRKGGRP